MKNLTITAVCVLCVAMVLSIIPIHAEGEIYNDVLRFHVRAVSDSPRDQEVKQKVRDEVLDYLSDTLDVCTSYEEALEAVSRQIPAVLEVAEGVLRDENCDYTVRAEITTEKFPRIDYGSAVMPSGVYRSLTITLGEGKGQNWWCVLFPTVCVRFAESKEEEYVAAGFTPAEYRIITGNNKNWRVRFRLLEILSEVFDFEY